MTDRYKALIVTLEQDIRADDAEPLISAISHLREVVSVDGMVAGPDDWTARQRIRSELSRKLWEALESDREG